MLAPGSVKSGKVTPRPSDVGSRRPTAVVVVVVTAVAFVVLSFESLSDAFVTTVQKIAIKNVHKNMLILNDAIAMYNKPRDKPATQMTPGVQLSKLLAKG